MKEYLTLLAAVQGRGEDREDRTGVGTRSIFGHQSRYNLEKGFPLLTTKKLHVDSIIHELIWFLRGDTNVKYLQENGVRIWNEWADKDGEIGPMYGKQWRSWPTPKGEVDQLAKVVDQIEKDPTSRRHLISAWNVGQLDEMALAPCHCLIQFYVRRGDKLDCQVYQRSADVFLGVPFNIASYALLTHLVANQVGLKAGRFIHTIGDAHIYQNHFDQVDKQLRREPKDLPKLILRPGTDLFDLKREDIIIEGYDPEPHIPAPIAV